VHEWAWRDTARVFAKAGIATAPVTPVLLLSDTPRQRAQLTSTLYLAAPL
jgi:hypothetical protein